MSETDHVDRTRAFADVSQTIGDSLSRERAGRECGLKRRVPQRQLGGKQRGVCASGTVSGPVRISLTGNLDDLLRLGSF